MKNLKQSTYKAVKSAIMVFAIITTSLVFAQKKEIKNVLLVHGAFADGSGWESVYSILKKKGYNVAVAANPNTSFTDDVTAVNRALDQLDGPTILVGHSYGGAIITEAGNSDKVVGLVYISAFVPDSNESLLSLLQSGPPAPNSGILPPSKDGFVWYDKAKFHSGFCADLPKSKADFMADSQVPVAASVFGAVIAKAAWKTKPSWYIVATEDQTIPPDAARFMAKRANAKVTVIKASHVVYISQPKLTSDVIIAAASEAAK